MASYRYGSGIDRVLVRRDECTGQRYFYYADALGNVRSIVDSSNRVVNSYRYDSFGKIISSTEGIENSVTYTGREWEPALGLYYYRNRWYDPTIGRFVSEDPIGFGGGNNFYAYVGNNPVNFSDPWGLYWFRQTWQTDFVVGRKDSPVEPGRPVSRFIEDYVPAGRTFGEMHDSFVDAATGAGIPDWLANIPSMIPVYGAAIGKEVLRTFGILDQPAQPTSCK